ncbi:MAG: hydrogenase [Candidatus Aenigmarchaeota archaeon]|nr:hydrogenase [Candidatus Aenigmarchaeota archaeon]
MKILYKNKIEAATLLLVFIFSVMLIYGAGGIHTSGDISGSAVAQQYLHNGSELTGSTNIVNSIVWDFRGFDTLGEEIVFFTGAIGVALVARNIKKTRKAGSGRKR